MSNPDRKIPQPTPVDELPPPEIPPHLQPQPPGVLAVTQVNSGNAPEVAVIYKRTYTFTHAAPCRLAAEQIPIEEDGVLHDEIEPGVAPSCKVLPEVIGYKTGTDVIIQADAVPRQPTSRMMATVQIGTHQHTALVSGKRYCEYTHGKIRFTPPELFEAMPLRYENAYGGPDMRFQQALLKEAAGIATKEAAGMATPENWRRATPVAQAFLSGNNPLMYPRNRFGKGYIIEDRREFVEGRELPNIERPDDLLTAERLVVGHPLDWPKQPIPAGFDCLDPLGFPRAAMMGIPAPVRNDFDFNTVPEVGMGLIPRDFCKGNAVASGMNHLPNLVHDAASRCASLGLWMPFMKGDEEIVLMGMDPAMGEFRVVLPGEQPVFTIPPSGTYAKAVDISANLHLVAINMHDKVLTLIWAGRVPLRQPLKPGENQTMALEIKVGIIGGNEP